jgi:hypothetical protein
MQKSTSANWQTGFGMIWHRCVPPDLATAAGRSVAAATRAGECGRHRPLDPGRLVLGAGVQRTPAAEHCRLRPIELAPHRRASASHRGVSAGIKQQPAHLRAAKA